MRLDEAAARFGLRSADVLQRLQALEDGGELSGVWDERGRWVCVTEEEMAALARFIERRGRVSMAELVTESNRIIDLTEKGREEQGEDLKDDETGRW